MSDMGKQQQAEREVVQSYEDSEKDQRREVEAIMAEAEEADPSPFAVTRRKVEEIEIKYQAELTRDEFYEHDDLARYALARDNEALSKAIGWDGDTDKITHLGTFGFYTTVEDADVGTIGVRIVVERRLE